MSCKARTALVTGATGGIGEAVALSLAKKGYNVVVHFHKNAEKAQNLVNEIKKYSNALAIQADLSKECEIEKLFLSARAYFSKIDTVVTCAGIAHYGSFESTKEEDFDRLVNVNVKGTLMCVKHALSDMYKLNYGRVVCISSIWGEVGASQEVLYSATKSAISGFVKALAKETADSGITVNAVSPGVVDTNMLNHFSSSDKDYLLSQIPVGRFASSNEVASLVSFLCSEDAEYITGEIMGLNGGFGK
ncbi:MAG: SDR family oxidoreductase [Clostridia bacterium]|nr:SDR family oxidoreductase [Clostridia bacterium]